MTDLSLVQIPIYIATGFGLGCAYFYLLAGWFGCCLQKRA